MASNLSISANKKRTFVYQKFSFCLSKPQAWHIIATRSAAYIIKGASALVSPHAPVCIFLRLDDIQRQAVDDIPQQVWMIYKATP